MKITRCYICDKPFFPNPFATDFAQGFDPNACPQCNANAIKNSQIVDNKTYSIAQTLAEERERMVEIVGADKELKHQECISGAKEMCESCNGRQIINYEKQRIRTALFSLEKLTGKE